VVARRVRHDQREGRRRHLGQHHRPVRRRHRDHVTQRRVVVPQEPLGVARGYPDAAGVRQARHLRGYPLPHRREDEPRRGGSLPAGLLRARDEQPVDRRTQVPDLGRRREVGVDAQARLQAYVAGLAVPAHVEVERGAVGREDHRPRGRLGVHQVDSGVDCLLEQAPDARADGLEVDRAVRVAVRILAPDRRLGVDRSERVTVRRVVRPAVVGVDHLAPRRSRADPPTLGPAYHRPK